MIGRGLIRTFRATRSVKPPSGLLFPRSSLLLRTQPLNGLICVRNFVSKDSPPAKTDGRMKTQEELMAEHETTLSFRERQMNKFRKNKAYYIRNGMVGGIIGGTYLIYSLSMKAVYIVSDVAQYAQQLSFGLGFATAAACFGVVSVGSKLMHLRPEPVYKKVVKTVLDDDRVKEELGDNLKVSTFRAFTHIDGGLRIFAEKGVDYHGWTRVWRPAQLQILFSIQGDKARAMIGCEVESDGKGGFYYNVLAVNNLDTSNRVVLHGDANKSVWKGQTQLR